MPPALPPTPCLLGPTGSGKSDVALALARATNGEVVACDAFSVYRGMAILTAAPVAHPDVPHHLVAEREPSEPWSAATFAHACDRRIASIRARGRTPWIVGGSALYLRGWLKGFGAPVARDEALRTRLRAWVARRGPERLHGLLARVDPRRAADLHPNDVRRVVRALEIVRATGRPASAQRGEWAAPDRRPAVLLGIRRSLADLDDRIRRRTEAMFEAGVVEEARRLLEGPLSPEARKVLGLEDLARLLRGEIDAAEAKETIARRTRRFARKQLTFFASFEDVAWVDAAADAPNDAIAERLLAALAGQRGGTSA